MLMMASMGKPSKKKFPKKGFFLLGNSLLGSLVFFLGIENVVKIYFLLGSRHLLNFFFVLVFFTWFKNCQKQKNQAVEVSGQLLATLDLLPRS